MARTRMFLTINGLNGFDNSPMEYVKLTWNSWSLQDEVSMDVNSMDESFNRM